MKKILYVLSPILVLLLVLWWEWGARNGVVNIIILPEPSRVIRAFARMLREGTLQMHIFISFRRVMTGYLMGAGAGIVLGFVLGNFKSLEILTRFFLGLLRPIPPLALIPMLILWLGIGERSKIAVILLVAFWPTFVNTQEGIMQADHKLLELADVLQKSRLQIIMTIVLPSALPYIFAGLRLSISRAWGGVVVAEMLAASAGVGFLIQYSRELSKPDMMLAGVTTIAVIGYLIDTILKLIHKKVCYWHTTSQN